MLIISKVSLNSLEEDSARFAAYQPSGNPMMPGPMAGMRESLNDIWGSRPRTLKFSIMSFLYFKLDKAMQTNHAPSHKFDLLHKTTRIFTA